MVLLTVIPRRYGHRLLCIKSNFTPRPQVYSDSVMSEGRWDHPTTTMTCRLLHDDSRVIQCYSISLAHTFLVGSWVSYYGSWNNYHISSRMRQAIIMIGCTNMRILPMSWMHTLIHATRAGAEEVNFIIRQEDRFILLEIEFYSWAGQDSSRDHDHDDISAKDDYNSHESSPLNNELSCHVIFQSVQAVWSREFYELRIWADVSSLNGRWSINWLPSGPK